MIARILCLALALVGCSKPTEAPQADIETAEVAAPTQPRFDPAKIAAAEAELRKEPKVVDLLFDQSNVVEWEVAVRDDGTNRSGYATYLCLKLRELGASDEETEVRIIDAAKRSEFQDNYRAYSLGGARCATGQFFD